MDKTEFGALCASDFALLLVKIDVLESLSNGCSSPVSPNRISPCGVIIFPWPRCVPGAFSQSRLMSVCIVRFPAQDFDGRINRLAR